MKKHLRNSLNSGYNPLALLLVFLLLSLFQACKQGGETEQSEVIATYGESKLRVSELEYFLPELYSEEDSSRYAEQFIRKWLRQQVVKEAAGRAIQDIEEKIQPQLQDYESTLMEQQFAKWLIDTHPEKFEVSKGDIRNYYNQFSDKFISEANYYQFFYIKTTKAAQYWIINELKEGNAKDIQELIEWCAEEAQTYKMDSTFRNEGELLDLSQGYYFGNIRKANVGMVYPYQQQEGDIISYCFFKMLSIVKEGEIKPLRMVSDEIELIIKNQRKQALINQTIARLVEEARATNKFERVK